jgi:hypothetical protein
VHPANFYVNCVSGFEGNSESIICLLKNMVTVLLSTIAAKCLVAVWLGELPAKRSRLQVSSRPAG